MKIPNYSEGDTEIYDAADLAKALQTPRPESPFQVGDSQLIAIRESTKIYDADTKIPDRDAMTTTPDLIMKKMTKLPWVEDQTAPHTRVDT